MAKELLVGMRVRCKSHQTAGTFEGVIKDTNTSVSGAQTVNVKVDTVNGAKMACPFDRWTALDEVEDFDNPRYLLLMQFSTVVAPHFKLCAFESDNRDMPPGNYQGFGVKDVEEARKYAEEHGLVFVNKSRKG